MLNNPLRSVNGPRPGLTEQFRAEFTIMNLTLQDLIRPARLHDLRELHPAVVGIGAKQCWQFPGAATTARG